jgi:hypothetical protein
MTTTARDVLAVARELADDLLFPDAMRVDRLEGTAGGSTARRPGSPGGALDDELADCRQRLDDALSAGPEAIAEARAAASELAVRAAAALTVQDGSKSVMVDQHAQRLVREAQFLLVFGSRPAIKSALLRCLGTARSAG